MTKEEPAATAPAPVPFPHGGRTLTQIINDALAEGDSPRNTVVSIPATTRGNNNQNKSVL